MKRYPVFLLSLVLGVSVGSAQQSVVPKPDDEEATILSPFEVSSVSPGRYQSNDVAAGGRIATRVLDTPSSITVLTSDFIDDIAGGRTLDAARYVAGVTEATIPNAQDLSYIRGFQAGVSLVDGFAAFSEANYDYVAIERIEVTKGPDAILQPAGIPGGSINLVTKKPKWDFGGSLKMKVGEYEANRVEADVTGPINSAFAYRLVAAVQDSESYMRNTFRESFYVNPSLTWRIAPATNLTLRYEHYDFEVSTLIGTMIDPLVGTDDAFRLMPGMPRDFNAEPSKEASSRWDRINTGSLLFTSAITDRLSVRLAGRLTHNHIEVGFFRYGPLDASGNSTLGGSRNPFSGKWEGGILWQNMSSDQSNPANWVSVPAPQPAGIFLRAGGYWHSARWSRDMQNDWAYIVESAFVKSSTLVGFSYHYERNNTQNGSQSMPSFTLDNIPSGPVTRSPTTDDSRILDTRYQSYITEVLELFDSRVILSGGIAHLSSSGYSGNTLSPAVGGPNPEPAGMMFSGSQSKTTYSFGVVVKPVENASLYYGRTQNAVPTGEYRQQFYNSSLARFNVGKQEEFGLKMRFFEGRIFTNLVYYEISQSGYSIGDPRNFDFPRPVIPYPNLIVDRKARGWELQVIGSITPQLSLILAAADTKNRDPLGIMLRGATEDSALSFLRYEFKEGTLSGLSAGIGASWLSKRAVDTASGLTPLGVPNQPSAYVPARMLVDAHVAYERGPWSVRVDVTNLADKVDYAALGRNVIQMGNPRAFSGSVTWKF